MLKVMSNFPDAASDNDGEISSSSSSSSSASNTIQKTYFVMNIVGVTCVVFAAVFLFLREFEEE